MIRVLIVEDQRMAREHMEGYVHRAEGYTLAGSIGNAAMAELFCAAHPVDLVLMDVCTEHDESGLDAARVLKKRFAQIRIVIVTSMAECSFLDRAREAGAESFWYKDMGETDLLSVMERTMRGESVYPEHTPKVQIGLADSSEFTGAELRVLRLIVEGQSYEEIADALGIKPPTVRYHINNMLQKTGYANKTRLAIAVTNKKLILPEPDRVFKA